MNRPDDKDTMLQLATLFKSNWNSDGDNRGRETTMGIHDESAGGNARRNYDGDVRHGEWYEGRRFWGESALYWFERAVRNVVDQALGQKYTPASTLR